MAGASEDDRLFFNLEGPGVTPETVDVGVAMLLAGEYFDLVRKLAAQEESNFRLSGIWIEKGSARLASRPSSVPRARSASIRLLRMVRGDEAAPPQLDGSVNKFKKHLSKYAGEYSAGFSIGKTKKSLELVKRTPEDVPPVVTSMRAKLVRLEGAEPAARFSAKTEAEEFTVRIPSEDVARQLGPHVYRHVDIVVRIVRDDDGNIASGDLVEFEPLQTGDTAAAWREWFKSAGAGWEQVEDVEAELHAD